MDGSMAAAAPVNGRLVVAVLGLMEGSLDPAVALAAVLAVRSMICLLRASLSWAVCGCRLPRSPLAPLGVPIVFLFPLPVGLLAEGSDLAR